MKYGYIERINDRGYDLICPLILSKISLSTCGHSTFVFIGKQYSLIKKLKQLQDLKIELFDPTQLSGEYNLCIEYRREYNLFFCNTELIIRPTLELDRGKEASHPVIERAFQFKLRNKWFLPKTATIKNIVDLLINKLETNLAYRPVSIYQVGRIRLNQQAWIELNLNRNQRIIQDNLDRIPSYSASEFEFQFPPEYYEDEEGSYPLPRYSTNGSNRHARNTIII
ncbi:hypothetical protein K502DRAFT_351007 [Neoconidiobolus thromboides FSU 785]|nr:hypothetical protein K502DRAFT_351007 [Neoconidiobolus thromboides FSU 785]